MIWSSNCWIRSSAEEDAEEEVRSQEVEEEKFCWVWRAKLTILVALRKKFLLAEIQLSESDFFSVFLFKLIEPSPDVDTERWISWYDELSECVKIFTVSS